MIDKFLRYFLTPLTPDSNVGKRNYRFVVFLFVSGFLFFLPALFSWEIFPLYTLGHLVGRFALVILSVVSFHMFTTWCIRKTEQFVRDAYKAYDSRENS